MTPTRSQLHAWIWQVPITQVAQALHMSSRALNRTCVRLRIPTPPRGYWRRVETGHGVVPTPLPDPDISEGLALDVEEEVVQALLSSRAPLQASVGSVDPTPAASDGKPLDTEVSPVAPWLDSLFEQAERHDRWLLAEAFLEEVAGAMGTCDPATRAVLALWVDRGREALARAAPVAQVTAACERVALGREEPEWWKLVSRKGS